MDREERPIKARPGGSIGRQGGSMIARHEPLVRQKNIKKKKERPRRQITGTVGATAQAESSSEKTVAEFRYCTKKKARGCKRPVRRGCTDREVQQWEGGVRVGGY
jgi:hypothetical protein